MPQHIFFTSISTLSSSYRQYCRAAIALIVFSPLLFANTALAWGSKSTDQTGASQTTAYTVEQLRGNARIIDSNGQSRRAKVGQRINPGQRLIVEEDSLAVIHQGKGFNAVIEADSEFEIIKTGFFSQVSGLVYYWFGSQNTEQTVRTGTSTIGIRGTEFLINNNKSGYELTLAKGQVEITSLTAEFQHYKAQQLAEFERYKREQLQAFEAYKQQQQEYLGSAAQITVNAGTTVTVDTNKRFLEQPALLNAMKTLHKMRALAGQNPKNNNAESKPDLPL